MVDGILLYVCCMFFFGYEGPPSFCLECMAFYRMRMKTFLEQKLLEMHTCDGRDTRIGVNRGARMSGGKLRFDSFFFCFFLLFN